VVFLAFLATSRLTFKVEAAENCVWYTRSGANIPLCVSPDQVDGLDIPESKAAAVCLAKTGDGEELCKLPNCIWYTCECLTETQKDGMYMLEAKEVATCGAKMMEGKGSCEAAGYVWFTMQASSLSLCLT